MEKFQLYVDDRFLSPYAMSAFVALTEKDVKFELIKVDLVMGETNSPAYAQASLTRRVPMLVHEDFSLSESSAIGEYLDEIFPDYPLYPREIRERARARQIQAWLRSDMLPLLRERSTEIVFLQKMNSTPLSSDAQEAAKHLFYVADSLINNSAMQLFTTFCLADVDLAITLNRLVINGDQVPKKLTAYARRQWERPSVKLWLNQPRPI